MLSSTPRLSHRRPFFERLKWFLVNAVCAFVPSKKYRDLIRYYSLRYRVRLGRPPLAVKKRLRPINLALGFDGRVARQAGVTLASLLVNSKNRASYDIHCVADDSVTPELKGALTDLVREKDPDSTLKFLEANRDFDEARCPNWPISVYYRLMLPALLPELDEIIYADVDVIFCRDLLELADLDLGGHLIAGVQERAGGYVNSGFMVLNLARLRRENIYETWVENARRELYAYPDQDILNITCRGRILHLPVKYNFIPFAHHIIYRKGVIPPQDHHELKYGVVMIHYAGDPKPWREKWFHLSGLWWDYARLTPFYEDFLEERP